MNDDDNDEELLEAAAAAVAVVAGDLLAGGLPAGADPHQLVERGKRDRVPLARRGGRATRPAR